MIANTVTTKILASDLRDEDAARRPIPTLARMDHDDFVKPIGEAVSEALQHTSISWEYWLTKFDSWAGDDCFKRIIEPAQISKFYSSVVTRLDADAWDQGLYFYIRYRHYQSCCKFDAGTAYKWACIFK